MSDCTITWTEGNAVRSECWRSAAGAPPPDTIVTADDRLSADAAYRLATQGTAILWLGDYHNAHQLLDAMARRLERSERKEPLPPADAFHRYRQLRSREARVLGKLLVPVGPGHRIPLRRAPDVHDACMEVYGPADEAYVTPLRELLGSIGAHEWRRKGIGVPEAGGRIHPHHGVFAPIRREYVELVAKAPLPSRRLAFDIGTGTGVLAAVLARRGLEHVVATDNEPRALACARDNVRRLGLTDRIEIVECDLFPQGTAPVIVCNPPWLPARPSSVMEHAIYDPDSRMLRGFLRGLSSHLDERGEGWLVLSDLAEHLGLRTRSELLSLIDDAGLKTVARHDVRPVHPRSHDSNDALHAARRHEVTSLWRLARRPIVR